MIVLSMKERNKNWWKKLVIVNLVNWILIGIVIYLVDPEAIQNLIFPNSYLPMMILLWGGFFLLWTLILRSSKKAVYWTLASILFVYLRIWGLGTILNGVLILGLLLTWEYYKYSEKKEVDKKVDEV